MRLAVGCGKTERRRRNAASGKLADKFLLVVVRKASEKALRPGDGCLAWVSEEVVESHVAPGASEEETVGRPDDLGEAAKAQTVVQKIYRRLKA